MIIKIIQKLKKLYNQKLSLKFVTERKKGYLMQEINI